VNNVSSRPTFACIYKSGGDYRSEHVQALQANVRRFTTMPINFVCYTDKFVPGVDCILLEKGYPGWWSVPEVFRQAGSVVVAGLDSIFVDSLDPFFELAMNSKPSDFWMIKAFAKNRKYASGMMSWNGDWSWLWKNFDYNRAKKRFRGEQEYTINRLTNKGINIKTLNDRIPGIYSYRWHCQEQLPVDARAVLFHGQPRPQNAKADWIKDFYKFGN